MSNLTAKLDEGINQVESFIGNIRDDLKRLDSTGSDQRNTIDAEIERKLTNVENLLTKMTNDVKNIRGGDKDFYEGEVKRLRTEHSQSLAELRQKRLALSNDPSLRQRDQLIGNSVRSKQVSENLDEAIRLGNETITTGNAAMSTLLDDGRRLENIDKNVDAVDAEAHEGSSRARGMLYRACLNGFIQWTIVFLLFIILLFSIWYKILR